MTRSTPKTGPPMRCWLLIGGAMMLLSMLLYACQPATPTATEAPPPPPPTQTSLPDQTAIWVDWRAGVHGNTYDLGKGPNTFCSRCHSPQNWDPAAKVDRPPNCVTCKFPTDPAVRQAKTMAFVTESDWKGIGCEQCHQVDANGIASKDIAWLNPMTKAYEPMKTSNELCLMCHVTSAGIQATGGQGVTHLITLGGSAHVNWAGASPQGHRPSYCTDCHDPHSGQPKQCAECHQKVNETHTKVQGMLTKVVCMACHDSSGMQVGPSPDPAKNGLWVTLLSTPSRTPGGKPTVAYSHSHSIQWQVSCDRCHKADNPFGLTVLTASGSPPPTPTPKP